MILETTQLLNNAKIKHDPNYSRIYRETHKNHPCSLWAAQNKSNFKWLADLGLALCDEYTYRYNKRHKCQDIIEFFYSSSSNIPDGEMTPFVQCMSDEYHKTDPVEAYRAYYRGAKRDFAKWTKRSIPEWWY